ncbi:MAG: A24 family peptidase [Candidatus Colwellbacteria bacterium]|nr:A24 family peptidase [Candidatus Colwellbacteria bacterium]
MGITIFLAAPALILIGVISSYTDLKYGRIPNWLIIFGFVYAICLYSFLFGYNAFFLHQAVNGAYILKALQNTAIAFVSGVILWKMSFWSAGDAKLFAVYAAILPLEAYMNGYVDQFPSFNLLVNLFFPLVLVLIIKAIWFAIKTWFPLIKNGSWKEEIKIKDIPMMALKGALALLKLFGNFFFMYLIFMTVGQIVSFISHGTFKIDPFIMYFGILAIMGRFNAIQKKYKLAKFGVYSISAGYLTYLLILAQYATLRKMIVMALVFMVAITVTRKILDIYIQKAEIKEVVVKSLVRGTMLHSSEMSAIKNELVENGRGEEFGWFEPGGLKESQVLIIKEIFSDREETIFRAYRTFPFAPFLSLSVIITMITGISFIKYFQVFMK